MSHSPTHHFHPSNAHRESLNWSNDDSDSYEYGDQRERSSLLANSTASEPAYKCLPLSKKERCFNVLTGAAISVTGALFVAFSASSYYVFTNSDSQSGVHPNNTFFNGTTNTTSTTQGLSNWNLGFPEVNACFNLISYVGGAITSYGLTRTITGFRGYRLAAVNRC